MTGRRPAAWVAAAAGIALFAVGASVDPLADTTGVILFGAAIVSLVVVGALLLTRVPGNPIGGWLLLAGLLVSIAGATGIAATLLDRAGGGAHAIAPWLALVNDVLFFFPIVIVIVVVPLHFPDGRLPSAGWRWVGWLTVAGMTSATISNLFRVELNGAALLPNPLAAPSELQPLMDGFDRLALVAAVPAFLGAAASVVVRYRGAGQVERAQLRWLMADASIAAIAFLVSLSVPIQVVADITFATGVAALAGLPVAIGIAILRYRLYDIDRIISRTIGWSLVTGLLLVVFASAVIALQTALAGVTQEETLAVAASTLLAFALFQPLRQRVQRAVDRRFDRSRYDGERVVAAFGELVRGEVDLDAVAAGVRSAAGDAVRPSVTAVWLRSAATNGSATPGS